VPTAKNRNGTVRNWSAGVLRQDKVMEEPVFGLCPLCSQQKQLEKSHYLGRALHLLSQDQSGAVFMTRQRVELS
jgi:hypothetical protein